MIRRVKHLRGFDLLVTNGTIGSVHRRILSSGASVRADQAGRRLK